MVTYHKLTAWIFFGLSILHTIVGFKIYKSLSEDALWFFSAGMALFFAGAINLIHIDNYSDYLIRRLSIISNLLMTTFVLLFAVYTFQKNLVNPLAWLLIANAGSALFLCIRRRA